MIKYPIASKGNKCQNPACRKRFKPVYSSMQAACSPACAIELSKIISAKQDKERTKELRQQIETHGELEGKLEKEINACARALDEKDSCISCGVKTAKWDAGHFHSVGANNSLRFNLDNIHKQCFQCNQRKSGNITGYTAGLEIRYGAEYLQYVKTGIVEAYPEIKLSKPELRMLIPQARQLLKLIRVGEIASRKEANEFMGIYK